MLGSPPHTIWNLYVLCTSFSSALAQERSRGALLCVERNVLRNSPLRAGTAGAFRARPDRMAVAKRAVERHQEGDAQSSAACGDSTCRLSPYLSSAPTEWQSRGAMLHVQGL